MAASSRRSLAEETPRTTERPWTRSTWPRSRACSSSTTRCTCPTGERWSARSTLCSTRPKSCSPGRPWNATTSTGPRATRCLSMARTSPFDGGQCRAEQGGGVPPSCLEYNVGTPKMGYYIGGQKPTHRAAEVPYPNTYWFSYPGECPTKARTGPDPKTADCRKNEPGGLCPLGANGALGVPDGQRCTFNYKILGWIDIDDVFTHSGKNEETFFANGGDAAANTARIQAVLAAYAAQLTAPATGNRADPNVQLRRANIARMKPLPTVEALRAMNPPCYATAAECRAQPCQRILTAQICEPCKVVKEPICVPPFEKATQTRGRVNAKENADKQGQKKDATTSAGDPGKPGTVHGATQGGAVTVPKGKA